MNSKRSVFKTNTISKKVNWLALSRAKFLLLLCSLFLLFFFRFSTLSFFSCSLIELRYLEHVWLVCLTSPKDNKIYQKSCQGLLKSFAWWLLQQTIGNQCPWHRNLSVWVSIFCPLLCHHLDHNDVQQSSSFVTSSWGCEEQNRVAVDTPVRDVVQTP